MLLNAPLLGQRPSRCVGRGRALRVEAKKRRHCGDCKGHDGPAPAKGKAAASAAAAAAVEPAAAAAAQPAECAAPAAPAAPSTPRTQEPQDGRRLDKWPLKSDLYLLRSDGMSCTRETVQAGGSLSFIAPSSQQHLLVWKRRPQCVMVLKKLGDELVTEFVEVLRYLGEEQGMRVLVEPHEHRKLAHLGLPYVHTFTEADQPELHSYVDFVTCLGGDGLILHASLLFRHAIPPIVSFKLGSLGFLTCHEFKNFREDLAGIITGYQELESCKLLNSMDGSPLQGVYITLRMRLLCEIFRGGKQSRDEVYEVLNEVVVSRGANPFLTKIEVYERDTLITKVQADGVMLATPTGSTAYNVAAGGSMVHPNVPAIMFTPICPHSLSFRPVILPDYSELEFRISEDARSPAMVCLDGKVFTQLQIGDSVRVRMSPNPVPTINNADQTTDWFNSIERCFSWNERLEQKQLRLGGMHPEQPIKVYTSDAEDGSATGTQAGANGGSAAAASQWQAEGVPSPTSN